jgi:hypothetical protein
MQLMILGRKKKLLEENLPNELEWRNVLTSNPCWTNCYGKYESFHESALEEFHRKMLNIDQKITELEDGLKELD